MRSLIRFLLKFKTLFFFILLEVISLVMIINHNQFQRIHILSSSNFVVGSLYNRTNKITNYLSLSSINESLKEENAYLKQENTKLNSLIQKYENDTTYSTRFKMATDNHYTFKTARVIHAFQNYSNNYLIINKGESDGIHIGMGVINHAGLVGIVCNVSSHFSTIMPIINTKAKINAKIAGKSEVGTIVWNSSDIRYALLREVPQYIPVSVGDTVRSSSYSAIFPENIMIGTVTEIQPLNNNFYSITVNLSVDFENLSFVDVIELKNYNELNELIRKEVAE